MLSSAQFNGTKMLSPYPSGYRAATVKLSNPKFSGFSDGAASIFKPITEQYIYGFFAQDVVALWIPRIINALRRGRNAYNPNEDPNLREGHPIQQKLHALYMNVKGLNYPNCIEETSREVETGPGLIVAQSIIALGFAAVLGSKWALMMGNHELQEFGKALKQTIGRLSPEVQDQIKAAANRDIRSQMVMTEFIKDHLFSMDSSWHLDAANNELLNTRIDLSGMIETFPQRKAGFGMKIFRKVFPEDSSTYREILTKFAQRDDVFGKSADLSQITYKQLLEKWAELWPQGVSFSNQSKELEDAFNTLIKVFNLQVRKSGASMDLTLESVGHFLKIPVAQKAGEAIAKTGVEKEKEFVVTSSESFLENLRKFKGFVSEAVENAIKDSNAERTWVQNLIENGKIDKLVNTLLHHKLIYGVSATLAAGFLVILVSAMAQRGHSYPANRNLKLGEAGAGEGIAPSEASAEGAVESSGADANSQNQALNALLQGLQNSGMAPMPADISQQQPNGYTGYGQSQQSMGYPAQGYAANMTNPFGNAYSNMMSGYAQPTGQYSVPGGAYANYGFNSPQYPGGYGQ